MKVIASEENENEPLRKLSRLKVDNQWWALFIENFILRVTYSPRQLSLPNDN